MADLFKIDVALPASVTRLVRRLSPEGRARILDGVGRDVSIDLARYFTKISKTRHKTARRLGAAPSGILEFYEFYPPMSRGGAEINAYRRGASSVFVTISGIPFLSRAYGDLHIRPVRASALTIPMHRYAYNTSAAEMKTLGWTLFTMGRHWGGRSGILFGMRGSEGPIPLYRLVKHATVPQDAKLMPTQDMLARWARDSANEQIMREASA